MSKELSEGNGDVKSPVSSFQPRLGRGLVPGSVLDLDSSQTQRKLSAARKVGTAGALVFRVSLSLSLSLSLCVCVRVCVCACVFGHGCVCGR